MLEDTFMSFGDGIPRKHCFSVTDFHDFERCSFCFFVTHHLDKKYELAEGSKALALGSLLDETIKLFHSAKLYGQPPESLVGVVMGAKRHIKEKVDKQSFSSSKTPGKPSFYTAVLPFLDEQLTQKAIDIFQNYYQSLNQKIKPSLGPVGFCERLIPGSKGDLMYKLWGGPDAYEIGEDGVIEIVDYKSREDVQKGKEGMDMDLMPKMYTLLCSKFLMDRGYKKARFIVRFWQDPKEEGFYEEFDLEKVQVFDEYFRQLIEKILATTELNFCEKPYCKGCFSPKREEFLADLKREIGVN